MRNVICVILVILNIQFSNAQHELWNMLLQMHVTDEGLVDYSSFKSEYDKLNKYLKKLEVLKISPKSKENKDKATWLNAYNALSVKLILDNYPITSINDIKVPQGDIWNYKNINVGGTKYSLNQIEHDILRKTWSDPRIHAAINCASFSCAKLHNSAFTEANVETKLSELMSSFINDKHRNFISEYDVRLSKSFEWYGSDFKKGGNIFQFLRQYTDAKISPYAKLSYLPYDWSLNSFDHVISDSYQKNFTEANNKHWLFNDLLSKYVTKEGVVDYAGLKKSERRLNRYIAFLANTKIQDSWSSNEKKAFWINAYNAYTIKKVLENYPVKSIMKIVKNGKNVWSLPFAIVSGKNYTLNQIEHEILRKEFKDPRIHVGVNCAAFSCPKIKNTAYTKDNVEDLLEEAMKTFINDANKNKISQKQVELSQIFNWYQADFTTSSSLITYINKYSKIKANPNAKITYMFYNWELNGK